MSFQWMRRGMLALAAASSLVLGACGSGTIESQLNPTRVIAFGDGFSDLGQGGTRYTVNDTTVNIWSHQVAASFGATLTTAASGGLSHATGNARVNTDVDAAGGSAPTVKEQIDTFLASGTIGANDLVVVGAGTADVIAEIQQAIKVDPTQSSAQALANVQQAGRDLATQVRRLVQNGAKHVAVVGPYHLGKSPWAVNVGQVGLLTDAASKFNEELLVALVDLGANVLYVDAALFFNLMVVNPSGYGLVNVSTPACASVDAGPGIGIGAGEVNSALCTTSTLQSGVDYTTSLFADRVYPTPQGHRKFGEYAYTRIRERW